MRASICCCTLAGTAFPPWMVVGGTRESAQSPSFEGTLGEAPVLTSASASSVCPRNAAMCRGVCPSLSCKLTAAPCSKRQASVSPPASPPPRSQSRCNGVCFCT